MRRAGGSADAAHEAQIAALAAALPLQFTEGKVLLDGEDVSELIRAEAAGMDASRVSTLPAVREALLGLQQRFRQLPGLVADGRDMGTVIFPDAALKVFLTASAAQRAERRHKQLISKGISTTLDSLRSDLEARRRPGLVPQRRPAEAGAGRAPPRQLLQLSIEQSIDTVLDWWRQVQPFESASKGSRPPGVPGGAYRSRRLLRATAHRPSGCSTQPGLPPTTNRRLQIQRSRMQCRKSACQPCLTEGTINV